eukprot:scaffold17494_cov103-Isochrysis_galbana.AAC.1
MLASAALCVLADGGSRLAADVYLDLDLALAHDLLPSPSRSRSAEELRQRGPEPGAGEEIILGFWHKRSRSLTRPVHTHKKTCTCKT